MGSFPKRLKAVNELPKTVSELLDSEAEGATTPDRLATALNAASAQRDNHSEPSWPVLARLVRDEAIIEAHRRLDFLYSDLSAPNSDEYEGLRSFVGRHRYADLMLEPFSDQADSSKVEQAANAIITTRDKDPSKVKWWNLISDVGPRHVPIFNGVSSAGFNEVSEESRAP